jgi:hypothetical protein
MLRVTIEKKRISERRPAVLFVNPTWFLPAVAPVELPIGLNHLDSDFCWCDPIIEVDGNGQEIVLHRQVAWN